MRFASVAEVKNQFSMYLAQTRRTKEDLGWSQLAEARLREAWEGEDDGLYDCL